MDLDELFNPIADVWGRIKTVNGVTAFDSVNVEQIITHKITIYHDPAVTAETWIDYNALRYDIVRVENIDERDEFMVLFCTVRGDTVKRATWT